MVSTHRRKRQREEHSGGGNLKGSISKRRREREREKRIFRYNFLGKEIASLRILSYYILLILVEDKILYCAHSFQVSLSFLIVLLTWENEASQKVSNYGFCASNHLARQQYLVVQIATRYLAAPKKSGGCETRVNYLAIVTHFHQLPRMAKKFFLLLVTKMCFFILHLSALITRAINYDANEGEREREPFFHLPKTIGNKKRALLITACLITRACIAQPSTPAARPFFQTKLA